MLLLQVMKCKNSLYGHINQYHRSTVTLYECDVCGKQFRQKVRHGGGGCTEGCGAWGVY